MKNKLLLLASVCFLTALQTAEVDAQTLKPSSPQEEWEWIQSGKIKVNESSQNIETATPTAEIETAITENTAAKSVEAVESSGTASTPMTKTVTPTDNDATPQTPAEKPKPSSPQEEGELIQNDLLEKDEETDEVELVTPEVPKQVVGWYYDEAINNYVYRQENGQLKTGWYYDNDYQASYYFYQNGVMKKGWHTDPETGAKYYFNASGAMEKGWYCDQETGNYYYFRPTNGVMERGWFYDNDYHAYYYFQANGIMKKGWHTDPTYGGTYYFNTSGAMEQGWYYNTDDECYYFFRREGSGRMERGWLYDNEEWYFFNHKNGRMATGWTEINDQTYYMNGDGTIHHGLVYDDEKGGWYYFDQDGILQTGTITLDDIDLTVETDQDGKISSDVDYLDKINRSVGWFEEREGKVTYSMAKRNGPDSYDCSSSLYRALWEGDFKTRITHVGTTEDLYRENGYLFKEIKARDIRRGDVFISGNEGHSLGAGGHTGIAYNDNSILHCTYKLDGIYLTPIKGYTVEHKYPVRWFRIINQ